MKTVAKIVFLVISATSLHAQTPCIPDQHLPAVGIFPDLISLGATNMPYSQVIQFKAPLDTSATVSPFGTVPVKVDSIRVTGVIGLPAGITYTCNNSSCMVLGGESGCATMSGTTAMSGSFPLKIVIRTIAKAKLGVWIQQPAHIDTNYKYTLTIVAATGTAEISSEPRSLKVYPNPAHDRLFIDLKTMQDKQVTVKVFDVNGKVLITERADAGPDLSIDIRSLNKGIYFVETDNGLSVSRATFIAE